MPAVYAANLYSAGEWDRALRETDEVTAGGDASSTYAVAMARCTRALIWLARDDVGRADREAELAAGVAEKAKDVQVVGPAFATRARAAQAAGRRDEAVALAAQVSRMEPVSALMSEMQQLVDFALLLDELEMREELTRVLDALPSVWPWTRAVKAAASGDFVAAADRLTDNGHPLWEAMLRMRAGRALADQGRSAEAEEQVARSLEFFREVGATRYVREGEALAKLRDRAR
jgi:tetratricopeptide (TPR) repeat protein